MRKTLYMLLSVALVAAFALTPLAAWADASTPAYPAAVNKALAWLHTQQLADASFGTAGVTGNAILGLAAANQDLDDWRVGGWTPLDALDLMVEDYTTAGIDPANQTALVVQAVVAGGGDPAHYGGVDLLARLDGYYDSATGAFGAGNWSLTYYILAKSAARQTVPVTATNRLKSAQLPNGGWEFNPSWGADSNTTAMAIQALIAAGEPPTSTVVISGTAYLQTLQNDDGGFPWTKPSPWGTDTDANSTALVIQALIAAGQNPLDAAWTKPGGNPLSALLALQQPDGGFNYQAGFPGSRVMATVQALPALMGKPFPLRGRWLAARAGLAWLAARQNADGGFGSPASKPGPTADVVLAAAACGKPNDLLRDGHSPLDYLAGQAIAYTTPYTYEWGGTVYTVTAVAQAGKLAVAATAGEAYDPAIKTFGGITLPQRILDNLAYSPPDVSNSDRAWAILGLAALGEPVPADLLNDLKAAQLPAGGWEYAAWWGADSNTTALAIQALIAAGEPPTSTVVISGTAYLKTLQNDDGGFPWIKPSPWGTATDANSTGYVLQGLAAAAQDPRSAFWTVNPTTGITITVRAPLDALLNLQTVGGAFDYQAGVPGDQLAATAQALPGLALRAGPVRLGPCVVATGTEPHGQHRWATPLTARFNVDMDPATINATTVLVEGPQGAVAGAVGYDAATYTVVFTPTTWLSGNTVYTITIKGDVASARWGTKMGHDVRWRVRTTGFTLYLPIVARDAGL